VLRIAGLALAMALSAAPAAADLEATPDPLRSVMWDDMRAVILGGGAVVFDQRVRVTAPVSAEDALNVPVMVDASSLDAESKVEEIVVFADMNPIPRILTYRPASAKPVIGLRLKLQQATPVRAAARTGDGVWHVGGVFVDAAGGGWGGPGPVPHPASDGYRAGAGYSRFLPGEPRGPRWAGA
jgi:sulfur-oxidizing protein SoxY